MRKFVSFIIVFVSFLLTYSCSKDDVNHIYFMMENNCSLQIEFLFPEKHSNSVPFLWGTMKDLECNDTTINGAWKAHFGRMTVMPHSQWTTDSGFCTIEEMAPYDTFRVFVYDASYHYLPPSENDLDEFFKTETYYCRYDLTSENLYDLLDSNRNIVIAFPPPNNMSLVKMWPPYESFMND